jgi:N-acyl homoserine lactone hydrolase
MLDAVRRVDFGYFVRPAEETASGTVQVEPVYGYLVEHTSGVLLFDSGMGEHPEVDAHYRPRRIGLEAALRAAGQRLEAITEVANCHLHFDHCGGNPRLAGRPFFTQARELATARDAADYTLPELVDPPGTRWQELDGATEVLPGITLLPTPGHTEGHQSLVVRRSDGVVVVAGQSHDDATSYARDALARKAHADSHGEPLPVPPPWMETLAAMDPACVVFAHDGSIWVP